MKLRACAERWRNGMLSLMDPGSLPARVQWATLAIVVAATAAVRLWTIGSPALDRTAWKEIDYLQISTSYWHNGFHFLRPEIAWPAEPPRVTAMELPLVPYAAALMYAVFGLGELSARFITLAAFCLLPAYVFVLARRELGPVVGVLAGLASAAMPLYHPFGRFLFSEPPMILLSAAAVHHYAQWVDGKRRAHGLLALVAFSLAVAIKLEPLYLLLPLLWVAWRRFGAKASDYRASVLMLLAALALPLAWYAYAFHLGATSIDVFGVLRGHDKFQTARMLSDPEWRRVMYERVTWGVLGGRLGTLLAVAGVLAAAATRRGGLIVAYLLAVMASFVIVAEGNLDAPYRQLPAVPPLAVAAALGAVALVVAAWSVLPARLAGRAAAWRPAVVLAGGLVALALIPLRRHDLVLARDALRPAHPEQWELAQQVRRVASAGSKLVTVGQYTVHKGGNDLSPVLYHYTGLQGWTLQRGDWSVERVEALRAAGATHLAASPWVNEPGLAEFLETLKRRYRVVYENPARRLLLLDLGAPAEAGRGALMGYHLPGASPRARNEAPA